ncbi:SPIR1 protein, partial [Atractosteus spatula]|nr:SPIR1 protein [Atractosteus spatula]
MGCGGSKADAIEPRYYESWTRETESTWLTNTDTETPLPGVISNNHGAPESAVPSMKDSATMYAGKGDEGRPAQGYVSVSSSSAHKEKKTVNTSTQCGKQPLYTTPGTDSQRRAAFHREEAPRGGAAGLFGLGLTSQGGLTSAKGAWVPADWTPSERLPDGGRPGSDEQTSGDVNMEGSDGADELSLEEILMLYSQPINEKQAWAVCYQCCRTLAQGFRGSSAGAPVEGRARRIEGAADVRICKDGAVRLHHRQGGSGVCVSVPGLQVIESLGIMIYKALDYGLKANEERELSPTLEQLIDRMTNMAEQEPDGCPDEGYEATEEEDEAEEDAGTAPSVRGYRDVIKLCSSHLPSSSDAPSHYQAVCRALYAETKELRTFLEKIKSAKENLRKMEGAKAEEPTRDLNELQNADWARFWVQVMRDLRHGVKLKKVQERQYNPLPIEFQLTPYEMLMDDIRSKRYTLRKVMASHPAIPEDTLAALISQARLVPSEFQPVSCPSSTPDHVKPLLVNGNIPPKLKKSAHEVILDFIRSRPPLNPVAARKLKPHPPRPRSLHERILEEIKAERKLRPVSPDEIRRSRLVIRPLSMSYSFDLSGLERFEIMSDFRAPPDPGAEARRNLRLRWTGPCAPSVLPWRPPLAAKLFLATQVVWLRVITHSLLDVSSTPEHPRRGGASALANGKLPAQSQRNGVGGAQATIQRKRLLKAPTLAELDSSDSEEETTRMSVSSSSMSTSQLDDMSPDSAVGRKTPPKFLPISSTPQPERRQPPQRRHSIEKETPTNVRQFMPPSRQSSKSLVTRILGFFPRIPLCPSNSALQTVSFLSSHPFEASVFGVVGAVYSLCEGVFFSRWKRRKGKLFGSCISNEEFCYPVECLALTVEEVMHIRQVLVKAELEKFQQYKDVYNALKKGKLCFCCRTKRFSLFTWSYTCQFCKRPVCSQCCKKMRLPSKPYANLPIYSLGSSALQKEEAIPKPERPSTSHHRHHSLHRTVSRLSKSERSREELELPRELTEDWSTMEVCVDCKKFISEIISSSKRSLSLATKRARLKRKTQSFYMSSPNAAEYRPSERTIKEV